MKKQGILQYLTTVCFLLFIGGFFLLSIRPAAAGGYRMLRELLGGGSADFSVVETVYNERLPLKNLLITLNGGLQRLMGARVVNERYLLDNGQLTYVIDEYDMTPIAANTADLGDALEEQGIPMLYVNTPFKIDGADKQLPAGVEDYSNENADRFLQLLEERGVAVLDLRENIHEQGLSHGDLYYVTDHHWKAETGLWAFGEITDRLASACEGFGVDEAVTDSERYTHTVYENVLLGSAGRRVGPLYLGKDDLTVLTPKFSNTLHLQIPDEGVDRRGDLGETLLFPEFLEGDAFTVSAYDVYCGQDHSLMYVSNETEGDVAVADKRILVVKDSYSSVLIPFFALGYRESCFVDLRLYAGDLLQLAAEYDPDLVMVIYNPGAYEGNNVNMFDFLN